jgi:hypothetical protein
MRSEKVFVTKDYSDFTPPQPLPDFGEGLKTAHVLAFLPLSPQAGVSEAAGSGR